MGASPPRLADTPWGWRGPGRGYRDRRRLHHAKCHGGAIYVSAGTTALTNGTVAFNTAQASLGGAGGTGSLPGSPGTAGPGQGGGLRIAGGTLNALNTLVGDNTATSALDVFGALTSLGYNLIGNSSGGSGYADTDL